MITRGRQVRRRAIAVLGIFGLVATVLAAWHSAPAGATTVTDEASFRAAWTNAAETLIDLTANITLTCTDGGGNGVSVRNSGTAIVVDGHGFTLRQTCTTGTNNGVLQQDGTGNVTLQNITMTGGNTAGLGGAINAPNAAVTAVTNSTFTGNSQGNDGAINSQGGGSVTVTSSTISGNTTTSGSGGAMNVIGDLTITGSTVSGNSASGSGGALNGIGSTTVTNSTINGNTSGGSGGGINRNGSATVINSTISGNTSGGTGGGINPGGSVTLVYATVVQNSAVTGSNIRPASGGLTSFGSVVALPLGGGVNCANLASTTSNGFNFSDDSSCGFTASTDRQSAGDPGLGALANNGGPTQTQKPQPGSPLIDAIPVASCQADGASGVTTDQRGVTRPQGAGCDIGAVEVEVAAAAPPAPAAPVAAAPRFTG